jgi:hypothetical protein
MPSHCSFRKLTTMRYKPSTYTSRLLILFFQLLLPTMLVLGQPGGDGDLSGDPDAAVPVDGGTTLLLAAGMAYGTRRVRQAHQMKRKP